MAEVKGTFKCKYGVMTAHIWDGAHISLRTDLDKEQQITIHGVAYHTDATLTLIAGEWAFANYNDLYMSRAEPWQGGKYNSKPTDKAQRALREEMCRVVKETIPPDSPLLARAEAIQLWNRGLTTQTKVTELNRQIQLLREEADLAFAESSDYYKGGNPPSLDFILEEPGG